MAADRTALLIRLFPELDPETVRAAVRNSPGATFDSLVSSLRTRVGTMPPGAMARQALDTGPEDAAADNAEAAAEVERRAGAGRLLEGLREPLFPLPGSRRWEPNTMTDALPLGTDLERGAIEHTQAGPEFPRPLERFTPREGATLRERSRINAVLGQLPPQADEEARRMPPAGAVLAQAVPVPSGPPGPLYRPRPAGERTIPGTHYIRDPETGEVDIYDDPPESLAPHIVPPESIPRLEPKPSAPLRGSRTFLGRRGLYEASAAQDLTNDYQIVDTRAEADAVVRQGGLPLIIPPSVMAHDPTPAELDDYRRAQYETPDAPFGQMARERSGFRGEAPQVDPRYDESDAPMRDWPLESGPPDWVSGLQRAVDRLADIDLLAEAEAEPEVLAGPTPPERGNPPSLADLIPPAPSPEPLRRAGEEPAPQLSGSLPVPAPSPRSQLPLAPAPDTPRLIPLADYLQQRLLEVGRGGR